MVMEGSSRPTAEKCELLGNKAAQLSIDANIPLSDAVVKVANSQCGLNNTHLNNICWAANNEYFRKIAQARKMAGEENLVFEFDLADPPDVIKRVNAAAQPKVAFIRETDYQTPPEDFRVKEAEQGVTPELGSFVVPGMFGAIGAGTGAALGSRWGTPGAVVGGLAGGAGGALLGRGMARNYAKNKAVNDALIKAYAKRTGKSMDQLTGADVAEALGEGSAGKSIAKGVDFIYGPPKQASMMDMPPAARRQFEELAKKRGKEVKDLRGEDFREGWGHFGEKYKKAEAEPYSYENPIMELGALREELRQVQYEAMQKSASIENHLDVLEERFYQHIKQAGLSGTPLGHIVDLLSNHPDGPDAASLELQKVASRMAKEEPIFFGQFAKTAEARSKGLPDLEHPIYDTYGTIRDLRRDHYVLKLAEKQAEADAAHAEKAERQGLVTLQKEWGGFRRPA